MDLLEPDGRDAGGYLIAVDTVGAGAGEVVLVLDEGTSARQIVGAAHGPLRTVVVGIVDAVEGPAAVAVSAATAPGPVGLRGIGADADRIGAEAAGPARRRTRRARAAG